MGDVVQFKKPSRKEIAKGKTMCSRGFHKWVIDQNKQFDVKQGKLITVQRCNRCGATKASAT